jgi:hypothetical protein
MTLLNIYAPTADKPKEQLEFLDGITRYINEYSNNLILASNLNTYLSELDKHGKIDRYSEYSTRLNNILEQMTR